MVFTWSTEVVPFLIRSPNPSIERTPSSRLRRLAVAAHVER